MSIVWLLALVVLSLPVVALSFAFSAGGAVDRWHQKLDQLERDADSLQRRIRALQVGRAAR